MSASGQLSYTCAHYSTRVCVFALSEQDVEIALKTDTAFNDPELLHHCADKSYTITNILLKHGYDANSVWQGKTAVTRSIEGQCFGITALLIRYGAKITNSDIFAIIQSNVFLDQKIEMFQFLIKNVPNFSIENASQILKSLWEKESSREYPEFYKTQLLASYIAKVAV